jgi:hypothetical protein
VAGGDPGTKGLKSPSDGTAVVLLPQGLPSQPYVNSRCCAHGVEGGDACVQVAKGGPEWLAVQRKTVALVGDLLREDGAPVTVRLIAHSFAAPAGAGPHSPSLLRLRAALYCQAFLPRRVRPPPPPCASSLTHSRPPLAPVRTHPLVSPHALLHHNRPCVFTMTGTTVFALRQTRIHCITVFSAAAYTHIYIYIYIHICLGSPRKRDREIHF